MPVQVREDCVEVYQRMPLLRDASPGKGGLCGGVPEDAMHLLRDASPGTVKDVQVTKQCNIIICPRVQVTK